MVWKGERFRLSSRGKFLELAASVDGTIVQAEGAAALGWQAWEVRLTVSGEDAVVSTAQAVHR